MTGLDHQTLKVSVVIPTIGRPAELRKTLQSVTRCRPRPEEIVVVDQSSTDATAAVVAEYAWAGAIHVRSAGRGVGLATNEGLRRARNEVVLRTDDDCSVAADWIGVAWNLASRSPGITTGSVVPLGNPDAVPSTKTDPVPHDYTGEVTYQVLYTGNAVLPRSEVLALGGFDERGCAVDNDFCYRWLKAERSLRYEPSLVVWHRDWRTPDELRKLYADYWWKHGRFYAKHLRRRDSTVLRFLPADLEYAVGTLRAVVSGIVKGRRPLLTPDNRGLVLGFIPGLVSGWRAFGRASDSP